MEREPWFIEHYDAAQPAVPVVVAPAPARRKVGYWRRPIVLPKRWSGAWWGWWLDFTVKLIGELAVFVGVLFLWNMRGRW